MSFPRHATDRIDERLRNSGDNVRTLDVHIGSGRASLGRHCINGVNRLLPGALNNRGGSFCPCCRVIIELLLLIGDVICRVGITGNAVDYG
jgi:hypothetical protein